MGRFRGGQFGFVRLLQNEKFYLSKTTLCTCEICKPFLSLCNSFQNLSIHLCFIIISSQSILQSQFITIMSNLLYVIAIILLIIWAAGYFAYDAGGVIHILLVIAVVAILLRVIRGRDPL